MKLPRNDFNHSGSLDLVQQLVEIVKRPGQTLGLYIREGNGADRTDGVFISRIAIESPVSNSGCLEVITFHNSIEKLVRNILLFLPLQESLSKLSHICI